MFGKCIWTRNSLTSQNYTAETTRLIWIRFTPRKLSISSRLESKCLLLSGSVKASFFMCKNCFGVVKSQAAIQIKVTWFAMKYFVNDVFWNDGYCRTIKDRNWEWLWPSSVYQRDALTDTCGEFYLLLLRKRSKYPSSNRSVHLLLNTLFSVTKRLQKCLPRPRTLLKRWLWNSYAYKRKKPWKHSY